MCVLVRGDASPLGPLWQLADVLLTVVRGNSGHSQRCLLCGKECVCVCVSLPGAAGVDGFVMKKTGVHPGSVLLADRCQSAGGGDNILSPDVGTKKGGGLIIFRWFVLIYLKRFRFQPKDGFNAPTVFKIIFLKTFLHDLFSVTFFYIGGASTPNIVLPNNSK